MQPQQQQQSAFGTPAFGAASTPAFGTQSAPAFGTPAFGVWMLWVTISLNECSFVLYGCIRGGAEAAFSWLYGIRRIRCVSHLILTSCLLTSRLPPAAVSASAPPLRHQIHLAPHPHPHSAPHQPLPLVLHRQPRPLGRRPGQAPVHLAGVAARLGRLNHHSGHRLLPLLSGALPEAPSLDSSRLPRSARCSHLPQRPLAAVLLQGVLAPQVLGRRQ